MSKRYALLFPLLALCFGIGCTHMNTVGEFSVLGTREWDQGAKYLKQGSFEGRDVYGWVLYIGRIGKLQAAVDSCLRAGNGDLLSNVKINHYMQDNVFWGDRGWIVTADVWKRAGTGMADPTNGPLYTLVPTAEGPMLVNENDSSNRIPVMPKRKGTGEGPGQR